MQINRRHMLQLADLLAHLFDNLRMAVPDRNRDDAGEAIEILLALFVPQILHVPFDHQQRIAVVRDQARRQILLPQGEDFLFAGAVVGRWLVIADRQLGKSLSAGDLSEKLPLRKGWGEGEFGSGNWAPIKDSNRSPFRVATGDECDVPGQDRRLNA